MKAQRRQFLHAGAAAGTLLATGRFTEMLAAQEPPAAIKREGARPQVAQGLASGDVAHDRAIIWSRCDRPARMVVEWAATDAQSNPVPLVLMGNESSCWECAMSPGLCWKISCALEKEETEATAPNVGTPAAGETPESALLSEPCCSTKQEQPLCFTLAVCRPTHLIFSAGLLRPHTGRGRVRER